MDTELGGVLAPRCGRTCAWLLFKIEAYNCIWPMICKKKQDKARSLEQPPYGDMRHIIAMSRQVEPPD